MLNQRSLNLKPAGSCGFVKKALLSSALAPFNRLSGLTRLDRLYQGLARQDSRQFIASALAKLGIDYRISAADLKLIPKTGPVLVMANHPYGGLEGLILADIMLSVRPDSKLLVNYLLGRVEELRDIFFLVDPFNRASVSQMFNYAPIREAMRFLKSGGALGLFPAGEVAHLNLKEMSVVEPDWRCNMARFIAAIQGPVLPVHFAGNNGPVFQLLGLVHNNLRTALLPRELTNKQKKTIEVAVGRPVPSSELKALGSDKKMVEFMRLRTMILGRRQQPSLKNKLFQGAKKTEEIIEAVQSHLVADEICRLPRDRILFHNGNYLAACAHWSEIPLTMVEISRLRELSFRAAGEGTGRSRDKDEFDRYYRQLFVWDLEKKEIIGGYRLAKTDEVLAAKGPEGLYTTTLFNIEPDFFHKLGPALEMGRAFVRPEYQRDFSALYLLWKAIGLYVCKNARYKTLFGLVSVSDRYKDISRQMIATFYENNNQEKELAALVSPKHKISRSPKYTPFTEKLLRSEEDLIFLVNHLEDGREVPALMRQYLKLGGSILKFSLDPSFSNTMDGLIVVDLSRTGIKRLERYMGEEKARRFKYFHFKNKEPDEFAA